MPNSPPLASAAVRSGSNHSVSATRVTGVWPRNVWSCANIVQMMRLASSSRLRARSASEVPLRARSIRIAFLSRAITRAAPYPLQHCMSRPPILSSSRSAILSMAGMSPERTGRSLLALVTMGSPSGVSSHCLRYSSNMGRYIPRLRTAALALAGPAMSPSGTKRRLPGRTGMSAFRVHGGHGETQSPCPFTEPKLALVSKGSQLLNIKGAWEINDSVPQLPALSL